jgi:integral membrane sensor domain MASE1
MHAPTGRWNLLLLNLLLALGYGVIGTISLLTVRDTGLAAPVWPAAGIAMAAVLAYGWRVAPGVALGSILVNVPAVLGQQFALSTVVLVPLAVACGAALQALAGSTLVKRYVGDNLTLIDAGPIVRFLLLAGPASSRRPSGWLRNWPAAWCHRRVPPSSG